MVSLFLIGLILSHHYYIHGYLFDLEDITALASHEFIIIILLLVIILSFVLGRNSSRGGRAK
jgi:hypothetical protein